MSYRNLEIWKSSRLLVIDVHRMTLSSLPKFEAFEEGGDVFDSVLAQRLERFVYAAGNRQDPAAAYRAFRGRDPEPDALLRKRGLAGERGRANRRS